MNYATIEAALEDYKREVANKPLARADRDAWLLRIAECSRRFQDAVDEATYLEREALAATVLDEETP